MVRGQAPPRLDPDGFEWDEHNRGHARRHPRSVIEEAFFDPAAVVKYNPRHSTPAEPRWLLLSRTRGGERICVVFTIGKTDRRKIRPITSWRPE